MKSLLKLGMTIVLFTYANCLFAYEPGTHGDLAKQAALKSNLGAIIVDLGFEKSTADETQQFPDPQGGQYIDLLSNQGETQFTAHQMGSVLDLIYAEAVLEDEFPRSVLHFYDPVPGHLDPLNVNGIPVPHSAPNWALEGSFLPAALLNLSSRAADKTPELTGAA